MRSIDEDKAESQKKVSEAYVSNIPTRDEYKPQIKQWSVNSQIYFNELLCCTPL